MTWVQTLKAKAEKAMQDSPNQDLDVVEFECEATPDRLLALLEITEIAQKMVRLWLQDRDSAAVHARIDHLRDLLTYLDTLEDAAPTKQET